jgi:mono/diheme cytochrome c family protein
MSVDSRAVRRFSAHGASMRECWRRVRGPLGLMLLSGLLGACGGSDVPKSPPSPGERLYVANCLACHQRNGQGIPGVQPSLAGTPVPIGPPEALIGWVLFGERPSSLPKGQFGGVMPQFGYLSDVEVATLLTYVRSSFGNHAAEITPSMVAEAREAHRSR